MRLNTLTKLVSIAFQVGPDHLLEVLRKVTNVVIKGWVRVASQEIVKLGDCSLEQIRGLQFGDDLCDLSVAF